MGSYEHAVDVERPLRAVYDQWTQFETYPSFLQDVEEVRQTGDDMTRWRVSIAGVTREFDARILEQVPDEVIGWMSTEGPEQGGTVRFSRLTPERTRVTLRMDFDPHGITEKAGDALGFVESSVRRSAEQFKRFIEEQGEATGAWRGEIHEGRTIEDAGQEDVDLRGTGVRARGTDGAE